MKNKELTYEMALHKAAAYCSASEKCESDLRDKLKSWDVSPKDQQQIIDRLRHEKFLDDGRFAVFFVRDKFRFNKWGKIKIAYALKQKQIPSSFIEAGLNELDEEEYEAMLKDLLSAKEKSLTYKDRYDKQSKLYRFALSRGFESSLINRLLKTEF